MEIVKIDFHGDTLFAQPRDNEAPLVAIKPIIDRLGLDWEGQRQRLMRDEILASSACIIKVPTPGGLQDTVALPLNLVPGFLFGISEGSVPDPEVRAVVLAYKRECHDVLYRHFFGSAEAPDDPFAGYDLTQKLALFREFRLARSPAQRQALIRMFPVFSGFTDEAALAPRRTGQALQGVDFVRNFLAERTDSADGGRVQARHLHEAYAAWAAETKSPEMTERAFAICLDALGVRKARGGIHYYLGIRLKHRLELAE